MTVEDALAALIEHWDDVVSRLDDARNHELRTLIAQVGEPGQQAAAVRLSQLLVSELPPGHPVRRALSRGFLYATAPADWPALRRGLLAAAGMAATAEVAPPQPPAAEPDDTPDDTPEAILADVTDRLLRAPALTEEEVRRRGLDPADPGLLRLDRPDGGRQWPSFQFAGDGGPPAVARAVNAMLGAEADPLGVADWWLSVNPWLGGRPSDLIGGVPDEQLLHAARAVTEEV